MSCTPKSNKSCNWKSNWQLKLGSPAAHRKFRLMLLPSGPDMVHGNLLHRTQLSTFPNWLANLHNLASIRELNPAIAVCRKRAPLVPRLARQTFIVINYFQSSARIMHWLRSGPIPIRLTGSPV